MSLQMMCATGDSEGSLHLLKFTGEDLVPSRVALLRDSNQQKREWNASSVKIVGVNRDVLDFPTFPLY